MAQPKLFDRVHSVARLRHLSLGTERAYSDWIRRFILFHRKRHPSEMGAEGSTCLTLRAWQYVFPSTKFSADPRSRLPHPERLPHTGGREIVGDH